MSNQYLMRISCKCALYTPDRLNVLLVEYGPNDYGLPGGHMEAGETPDQTIQRELKEELGLGELQLKRKDFWLHHNNKLILGYVGTLSESTNLLIQETEIRGAHWVKVEDIAEGKVSVRSYDEFIIKFQA